MASGTKTQKPKLTDGAVLWFKEKCPCGTEIEFEASTGMVFDKMMVRWDKAHAVHVEDAAHPQVIVIDPPVNPGIAITQKVMEAATKVEKTMLSGVTKKPSVVEMEEATRKAWKEKGYYEKQRIKILQEIGIGTITQDEAVKRLTDVNNHEQGKQEQSKGDQGAATPEGDAASSRV